MKTRRQHILDKIGTLVGCLMYYDRKGDEDLPLGAIEAAVAAGEITTGEIVDAFRKSIVRDLADESPTPPKRPWDEGVIWQETVRLTHADRGERERDLLATPQEVPEGFEGVHAVCPEHLMGSWCAGAHPVPSGNLEDLVGWWGEEEDVWCVKIGIAPAGWVAGLEEFLGW